MSHPRRYITQPNPLPFSMLAARQAFAYSVVVIFVLFFLSDGIAEQANTLRLAWVKNRRIPDFGAYQKLRTLSVHQFPLDDRHRRIIIVGDIHGMQNPLSTLLDKISYDSQSDVLIHVGDLVAKGTHAGSMAVLSYMASNNITGVRGNHDQKAIEWRGWINWIRGLSGGKHWLDEKYQKWIKAEAAGALPTDWVAEEMERDKSKWWSKIPKDWILFGEHYMVAHSMSDAQFKYMLDLPLTLYIPSAHTFIVHGGLLPSDPNYPYNHSRQPLARVPIYPPATKKGKHNTNDTYPIMRGLQELSILSDVPQNAFPWNVLNIRSVIDRDVTKSSDGKPWSDIWKHDMKRCNGFEEDVYNTRPKGEGLPCYPISIVYGHAASRGLDIKRWTKGLDSGCVYGRKMTALVLGSSGSHAEDDDEHDDDDLNKAKRNKTRFGEKSHGTLVSVGCPSP